MALDSGSVSTDVYIYKGALLPVELLRRHPHVVFCSSTGGAELTLTWVKPTRSSNILPEGIFLTSNSQYPQVTAFMTSRLGAVAFTVLWCVMIFQYVKLPCTVGQGRVCNTTAGSSS